MKYAISVLAAVALMLAAGCSGKPAGEVITKYRAPSHVPSPTPAPSPRPTPQLSKFLDMINGKAN